MDHINYDRKTHKSKTKPYIMGGIGCCPCCKNTIELTEHHDKIISKKIMICLECHRILEEYIKLQEKLSD